MTQPVRCFSSQWMTELLTYRNPLGTDANWIRRDNSFNGLTQQQLESWDRRVIGTSLAYPLLTLSSLIETVAYGLLLTPAFLVSPFNPKPFNHTWKLLDSSLFTMLWVTSNLMNFHWVRYNLPTHESLARIQLDCDRRFPFLTFERGEDRDYCNQYLPPPPAPAGRQIARSVAQGPAAQGPAARGPAGQMSAAAPGLVRQDATTSVQRGGTAPVDRRADEELTDADVAAILLILANDASLVRPAQPDPEALELAIVNGTDFLETHFSDPVLSKAIDEMDQDYFSLILTKAAFIVVMGEGSQQAIPDFFQKSTKEGIKLLRGEWGQVQEGDRQEIMADIQTRFGSLDAFTQEPEQELSKKWLKKIRVVIKNEYHGILLNQCISHRLGKAPLPVQPDRNPVA